MRFLLVSLLFIFSAQASDIQDHLVRCKTGGVNENVCKINNTLCLPADANEDLAEKYDLDLDKAFLSNSTYNEQFKFDEYEEPENTTPPPITWILPTGAPCNKNKVCRSLYCAKPNGAPVGICLNNDARKVCRCAKLNEAANDAKYCCDGMILDPSRTKCILENPPFDVTHDPLVVQVTEGCKVRFMKNNGAGQPTPLDQTDVEKLLQYLSSSLIQKAAYNLLFNNNINYCLRYQNTLQRVAREERTELINAKNILNGSYASIRQLQQQIVERGVGDPAQADSLGIEFLQLLVKEVKTHQEFYKKLFTRYNSSKAAIEPELVQYQNFQSPLVNHYSEDRCADHEGNYGKLWKHMYTMDYSPRQADEFIAEQLRQKKFAGGEPFSNFKPKRIFDVQFPSDTGYGYESFAKYHDRHSRLYRKTNNTTEDEKMDPRYTQKKILDLVKTDPAIEQILGISKLKEIEAKRLFGIDSVDKVYEEVRDVVVSTMWGFGATRQDRSHAHPSYTKIKYGEFLIRSDSFLRDYFGVLQQALVSGDPQNPGVKECLERKIQILAQATESDGGVNPGNPAGGPTQYSAAQTGSSTYHSTAAASSNTPPTNASTKSSGSLSFSSLFSFATFSSDNSGSNKLQNATSGAGLSGASLTGTSKGAMGKIPYSEYQKKFGNTTEGKKELARFDDAMKSGLSPAVLKAVAQSSVGANSSSSENSGLNLKTANNSSAEKKTATANESLEVASLASTNAVSPSFPGGRGGGEESSLKGTDSSSITPLAEDASNILKNLNQEEYKANSNDTLFQRITKAYRLSLNKLLEPLKGKNKVQEDFEKFNSKELTPR